MERRYYNSTIQSNYFGKKATDFTKTNFKQTKRSDFESANFEKLQEQALIPNSTVAALHKPVLLQDILGNSLAQGELRSDEPRLDASFSLSKHGLIKVASVPRRSDFIV